MRKLQIGTLIIAMLIPLMTGILSAMLSAKGMEAYATMQKPPLSPPPWVFSVAWTVLYLMMGLASYFIYVSAVDSRGRKIALFLYALQLIMNFMWSIIFFNWSAYLVAFIWLMVMWCIVIVCMIRFFCLSRPAAILMIPYILWLTFAAYLNMGTYILNVVKK